MRWDKLHGVRTALLTVLGFGALCVCAFLLAVWAGWAAIGVSLLVIEWLTGDQGAQSRR